MKMVAYLAISVWSDLSGHPAPLVTSVGHMMSNAVTSEHDAMVTVVTILTAQVTVCADDGGHRLTQSAGQ